MKNLHSDVANVTGWLQNYRQGNPPVALKFDVDTLRLQKEGFGGSKLDGNWTSNCVVLVCFLLQIARLSGLIRLFQVLSALKMRIVKNLEKLK